MQQRDRNNCSCYWKLPIKQPANHQQSSKIQTSPYSITARQSFPCFEEVHGIDSDGQSRFSDIIAFDTKKKKAYIIDPTIRYETSDTEQDSKIVEEKSSIYEKCIPFYKEKYANSFEIQEWFVRGLWFGRRGTFGESVLKFFDEMKLDKSVLKTIGEDILSDTIHIINNHIYNN